MSQTPEEMNSFEAVTRAGALPKPYRWDRPLPEVGAQVIVERPGGGEEVAVVTGHQPRQAADAPQALALATPDRLELLERRQQFEAKAFGFARQRARARRLKLKFVRCTISNDRKIRLYYASDNTEDVRDLMRDFAVEFGVEVELVQLAPREAAGQLGGLGPCGRPTCCSTFLKVFPNPTTKMAKDQGISLTPQKLSGRCGKLKCCLAYEADTYREYLEEVALRVGHTVRSPKGYAKVIDLNVLQRRVRVSTLANRELASFQADEVERVKGGVPQGDERGGFYHGPDGPPARQRSGQREERSAARPARPRRERSAQGSGRSKDTAARQSKEPQESGSEGKRPRRRRRRRRKPKSGGQDG